MALMTEPDLLAAVAHLPYGASLYQENVSWTEYEELLAALGDEYHGRIYFNDRRIRIAAPSKAHERPKVITAEMVKVLRDELNLEIASVGSTTLKRASKSKGAEPGEAFYIGDITPALVEGDLDLQSSPPPDLVIEIDRFSRSLDKFEIYAALGVLELWRWHGNALTVYQLDDEHYSEQAYSLAFPFLAAAVLTEFIRAYARAKPMPLALSALSCGRNLRLLIGNL